MLLEVTVLRLTLAMNFVRYGNTRFLFLPVPSMGGPRQMIPQQSRLKGAKNCRKDAHPQGMCVIEILREF
jgi:hypothetical protein